MEGGIQSSFIPKDAGKAVAAPRQQGSGLSDLLLLISVVVFVASGALACAVFLYKQYLVSSATTKTAQLQSAKDAFDPTLIQQLTRLDDRMRAADAILAVHEAPTALFLALSQATLTTISFQSLDLEAADPAHITIKMQGVAQSVNSIALQADLLSKNGTFTSPIFSDISRQANGVNFNLTALVNPAALNYVTLVSGAPKTNSPLTQPTTQTTPVQNPSPFSGSATSTPVPQQSTQSQSSPLTNPPSTTTPPPTTKATGN